MRNIEEQKALLLELLYSYLEEKRQKPPLSGVSSEMQSGSLQLAKGRLLGACMMAELELQETAEFIGIFTTKRKEVVKIYYS